MKSLKILLITYRFYPDVGGIEVNSEVLANQFLTFGADVRLVTNTIANGDKRFHFPVIRKPPIKQLIELHKWADVVFENNPTLRLSWLNIFIKKPLVIAIRTWINRADGNEEWQDKIKQWWIRRAAYTIAVSKAVQYEQYVANTIVIGNPYREELFRIIHGIKRDKAFVFMGRLVSDKGADMAVRLLHSLLQHKQLLSDFGSTEFPKLTLTIIGDGPEKSKLQQLARELNIENHVKFTGTLKGAPLVQALNEHRYILVPSRWSEPFGNVALEGMACGCIPIVSDGGGLPDAVGAAGVTFKRNDLDNLIMKTMALIQNPNQDLKLREKSREHLENHRPNVVAKKYLKVLESALNQK